MAGEGGETPSLSFPPSAHIHFAETGSTNADAVTAFQAGEEGPLWLTATRQVAGRGRQGRVWASGPDDFKGSFLRTMPGAWLRWPAAFSFMAGIAVYDTARSLGVSEEDLTLKWPNDVLVRGGKIAGILTQPIQHRGRTGIIIGIGVNLGPLPEAAPEGATSLDDWAPRGSSLAPDTVRGHLDQSLRHWFDLFEEEGFAPVRKCWLRYGPPVGTEIAARISARDRLHGVFEGIDDDGALLLKADGRQHRLTAADVSFGPGWR